nr:hypothetical protein [Rhodopirellula sp. SM50]
MKCPKCPHNQSVKSGMKCASCGYRFSFNPQETRSKGLTDGRFLAAVRAASQNDTAFFTRNQLYGTYCRRQKVSKLPGFLVGTLFFIFGALAVGANNIPAVAVMWFLSAIVVSATLLSRPSILPRDRFLRLIDRWMNDGKPLDKLIVSPSLTSPPPQSPESDLYDYGVQRLLIVQRDELVDLFVLNNLHAEQSMLVLSINGYPHYLLGHARRVLEEQPDLPVHLLHDADAAGQQMQSQLPKLGLPLQGRNIIDLGFSPDDFNRLKRAKQIDPKNRKRTLPVDVLALPFLSTGLAACFASEMTMSALLEEHAREQAVASSTSSFG